MKRFAVLGTVESVCARIGRLGLQTSKKPDIAGRFEAHGPYLLTICSTFSHAWNCLFVLGLSYCLFHDVSEAP
jgi:hypothetical protein